jgi:hypothetical protein
VLIELNFIHLIVAVIFTASCVYFNWKAGHRQGVLDAGSLFYDHAVKDTISYLVAAEGLPPHWKHQIDAKLVDTIAHNAAIERGYIKK